MGKGKDRKAAREAKTDKKSLLKTKKKKLKKSGGNDVREKLQNGILKDKEIEEPNNVAEVLLDNVNNGMTKLKKTKKKSVAKLLEHKEERSAKLKKKKKKQKQQLKEGESFVKPNNVEEVPSENKDEGVLNGEDSSENPSQVETWSEGVGTEEPEKVKKEKKSKTKKLKKAGKSEKKDLHTSSREKKMERSLEVDMANVDEISSVDEDCSRGMKKWIMEYKQSRPGLKVLQQRIDEFITAHEEQQEQGRKEREARAAEDGWTVVVHHKGRKKTTDAESGTSVGSVSEAAVLAKMSKKKSKEVSIDFYRFQKREAQRNEIMMLQSKFEQDKKRIQQLRAQRKFRPY